VSLARKHAVVTLADYRSYVVDGWRLRALPDRWTRALQEQVLLAVRAQTVARHPQTVSLSSEIDGVTQQFFLKIFHRRHVSALVKDRLRHSPAQCFWRQGIALSKAGFDVPLTIAVGSAGRLRIAKREFVVSENIAGVPMPIFLHGNNGAEVVIPLRKWQSVRRLARLVQRFHQLGFVHGDLVASNIFLSVENNDEVKFYFMDNDRTRRYPSWFGKSLRKRNLVQLNRLPLPGISLQDRMRFLHAYLDEENLSARGRQLARWLEAKTRIRRQEVDGADPNMNFRKLMQWFPQAAR